ncbi:MAG: hypothetical protein K940chlam9_01600 [Chlamydiae bacterium]|nr:hypothetical protein [Chlamydiota bacterium]
MRKSWNKERGKILVFALCLSLCTLLYTLSKSVTFTAEGLIKTEAASYARLSKAVQLLNGETSASPSTETPQTLLTSDPVLEKVAGFLQLQATIGGRERKSRLEKVFDLLLAEWSVGKARLFHPSSRILHKKIPVTDTILLLEEEELLVVTSLDYPGQTARTLTLSFQDESHFTVREGKGIWGEGALDTPFQWGGGSFTLKKETTKKLGSTYSLTLIPLSAVVESLQKTLQVKRDEENPSLLWLSLKHPNRHLATSIVNGTIQAYQNFLQDLEKIKVEDQLSYLKQKQSAVAADLEETLQSHKTYLETHLEAGQILTLEKELTFIAEVQAAMVREQRELEERMASLSPKTEPPLSFASSLLQIHDSSLPLTSAESLLHDHRNTLEALALEKRRNEHCVEKLMQREFNPSSLASSFDDPSLKIRFEKLHELNHHLADKKNWTEKERGQIQEQIEAEKLFLADYLAKQQEGITVQEATLLSRIDDLEKDLLTLLYKRHQALEQELKNWGKRASHFPQKWLTEQKILLTTEMQKEMNESITKLLEAKIVGSHLDSPFSFPLRAAYPPALPNSPHLLVNPLLGFLASCVLAVIGLGIREIAKGPSGSPENLRALGKVSLGLYASSSKKRDRNTLVRLAYRIAQKQTILISSQTATTLGQDLAELFSAKGEEVLLVDPELFSEEFLQEAHLESQLSKLKSTHTKLILTFQGPATHPKLQLLLNLANVSIFGVTDERIQDLVSLPEETIFLSFPVQEGYKLFQIVPLLQRLLRRISAPFTSSHT